MSKENRVFIISASDRYNFGDLLFNYIVDFFLSEYCKNKYEIIFTSLSGNDLQSVQGHKTVGLTKGLKRIGDGDVLIFAGGGVLGHKWAPMFLQAEGGKKIKKIKKLMPDWLFEGFIKLFYFKTKARYPYTRSINDFNKSVRVIYNSVGGGALNGMSSVETKRVLTRLKTASYISVRDQNIQNIISGIKSNLVPDSAILLSEKITKDELYSMAESNIKNILDQNYIILQFNKKISNRYFDEIQELITGIKNNFNFNIFLMPVNYIDNTDMEGMISHEKNRNCTVIKNKLKLFSLVMFVHTIITLLIPVPGTCTDGVHVHSVHNCKALYILVCSR